MAAKERVDGVEQKIIIHSDNLIEKTEIINQLENTNLKKEDEVDSLIKNMMDKIKKGKIKVQIEDQKYEK